MYLKLADSYISDSSSDGVSYAIDTGIPTMDIVNEYIDIVGMSQYPVVRKYKSIALEITVYREFASTLVLTNWYHNHLKTIASLEVGLLKFEDMLGDTFAYENATLENLKISTYSGVGLGITYNFRATDIVDVEYVVCVLDMAILVDNNILTIR